MAERNLSSDWSLNGTKFTYTIKDASGQEKSASADLAALLANAAEAARAVANGLRIRIREATGGRPFDEAIELMEDFMGAIRAGAYPARQREAGETRGSAMIRAIAAVMFSGDASKAQAQYDKDIAALCAEKGLDPEAEDDASIKAVRKIKAAYKANLLKTDAVKQAMLQFEVEAEEARTAKKKAELAKLAAQA